MPDRQLRGIGQVLDGNHAAAYRDILVEGHDEVRIDRHLDRIVRGTGGEEGGRSGIGGETPGRVSADAEVISHEVLDGPRSDLHVVAGAASKIPEGSIVTVSPLTVTLGEPTGIVSNVPPAEIWRRMSPVPFCTSSSKVITRLASTITPVRPCRIEGDDGGRSEVGSGGGGRGGIRKTRWRSCHYSCRGPGPGR